MILLADFIAIFIGNKRNVVVNSKTPYFIAFGDLLWIMNATRDINNQMLAQKAKLNPEDFFDIKLEDLIKNTDKKRETYLIFLNSYIEKLDKISSSTDFKKKIDNDEFFKKIYKQKQYWELIK